MKNDKLIEQFINDPNYRIHEDGFVESLITLKLLGFEKKHELLNRGTEYTYIKYKGKELKLHRIIYRKFIGPLIKGMEIHHKDSDASNNAVSNLAQVTHKENVWYRNNKGIDYVD